MSVFAVLAGLALFGAEPDGPAGAPLTVDPPEARLTGTDSLLQLVVTGPAGRQRAADRTGSAVYESLNPSVVRVDPDGLVHPVGDGKAEVVVRDGPARAVVKIEVSDTANTRPTHFSGEIVPILSKLGCNSGGCHGKAIGQNGFKLSLFGFDAAFDHEAIVREGRGRRVFPAAPDSSLLLLKATGKAPHGGGKRLDLGSPEYNVLRRWIAQGMPNDTGKERKLVRIAVTPAQRLTPRGETQQLRVTAYYDDNSTADVTRLAQFQSNATDLADVSPEGRVKVSTGVGEAAVMARFGGQLTVARVTVPLGKDVPPWEPPASNNLIDPLVFGKLKELGIPPSGPCSDTEFARRSSFDLCGILPDPTEVKAFEADPAPDKRVKWVDRLLTRPEYADYFALKWSTILRNKRGIDGQASSFAFHAWVRQSMAQNLPYDQFVGQIVAARGDLAANPPVAWYRRVRSMEDRVDSTAQLFLGLRIQCARCHHHPYEVWGQDDYYGFASFFSRVGTKGDNNAPGEAKLFLVANGKATNPVTQKAVDPKPLGSREITGLGPHQDPRKALVDWLKTPDNPYFAPAVVNRYWKHFFGRGLVEPEDDMRATNPPTNPELLQALSRDFIAHGYDLRHLVRTIVMSRAYDRSSEPNAWNKDDKQNYARFYPRRLPAEVMLDAVNRLSGAGESFNGVPGRTRAVQYPDDATNSYFLQVFGQPARDSVCECERMGETNLSQSLHLINSAEVQGKLRTDTGRAARWIKDKASDEQVVDELYAVAFSRSASPEEKSLCLEHLARRRTEGKLREGYEDLLWVTINSKEFQFNR